MQNQSFTWWGWGLQRVFEKDNFTGTILTPDLTLRFLTQCFNLARIKFIGQMSTINNLYLFSNWICKLKDLLWVAVVLHCIEEVCPPLEQEGIGHPLRHSAERQHWGFPERANVVQKDKRGWGWARGTFKGGETHQRRLERQSC